MLKRCCSIAILLAVLIGLCWSQAGAAGLTARLQLLQQSAAAQDLIPVMIHFRDQVDTTPFAQRSDRRAARAGMLQALKSRAGSSQGPLQAFLRSQGVASRSLWIVNSMSAEVPAALLDTLAAWPGVELLDVNATVEAPTPIMQVEPTAPPTWNIAATGAPTLWSEAIIGTGVTVAILDSGVNPDHPAMGTYRGLSGDWFNPYAPAETTPSDYLADGLAHGTAVTSLILGNTLDGQTIGMAPDAQWIAARIFDEGGETTNADILSAMQWALDPDGDGDPADAPDIVNNSWGFADDASVNQCLDLGFTTATENLQNAGIHVIYAGGNAGPDPATSVSPANNAVGFGAGSVDPNFTVSRFSSRGPSPCDDSIYTPAGQADVFPEMQLPGEDLLIANGTTALGGAALVAGTSFSAPHVSGALALLRQAFPFDGSQPLVGYRFGLETALLDSADDLGPRGPDNDYGYGLLNVDAAYLRLNGQASLSLYTPGAPENDATVDFNTIPPGTRVELELELTNVGGADLTNISIDATNVTAPFEVVENACPAVLGVDTACAVTLAFAPDSFGEFSTSLTIDSDDLRRPSRVVTVQGIGNSPPPAPVPVSPEDGAGVEGTTVELTWFQGDDPDGDPLTQTLIYADNNMFFPSTSVDVPMTSSAGALLLGSAGLLAGVLCCSRRRKRLWSGLLLLALLGSISCGSSGGGGSGGDTVATVVANQSHTLSGLSSATTYYWKVRVDDGKGGVVESDVRTFTTP